MTCELVRDRMCEYLDGLLEGRERDSFESHLSLCSECRLETEELKTTLGWLKQAGDVAPPQGLRSAVLEQLRRETGRKTGRFAGFSHAVAAAVVFLLLVTGNVYTLQPTAFMDGRPRTAETFDSAAQDDNGALTAKGLSEPAAEPEGIPEQPDTENSITVTEVQPENTPTAGNAAQPQKELPLRLLLNLILVPLFFLFSGLALKKRKEATP